jgi:Flp pilus assembly protein TadD
MSLPDDPVAEGRAAVDAGRPGDALPLLLRTTETQPENAEAWNQLGRALNNLRRLPEAREALTKAAGLAPGSAEILTNLGHVCRAAGDLQGSAAAFAEAVRAAPNSTRASAGLASVRIARGDVEGGLRLLRKAVEDDSQDARLAVQLADVLQGVGKLEESETVYRHALAVDPSFPPALAGLGAVLDALGRFAEAEASLRRALTLAPDDPAARSALCHVLELAGRSEEVLEVLRAGPWETPPAWASASAARQLMRLGRPDEAEQWLARGEARDTDPRSRAALMNARARLLDARGDYAAAFEMFSAANSVLPSGFDDKGFPESVNRLIRFFTPDRIASLPTSACQSDRPVFIVGMPRSGTSLVEQILSSHSRVHACGERRDLYRLPRRLSEGVPGERWPECLEAVESRLLERLATEYLDAVGAEGSRRITDKLPANFLNLGLIQLLFPKARVIYCRRDPLSTGLSCFQQDFQSPGMDFARRLEHIGLYQQGCLRLMSHWHQVLDLPVCTLDYEALIESPEEHSRRLVEFMGLEWEEDCLRFHQSERIVRTASSHQVRKPIYSSSVGRWRDYAQWLGPLRRALQEPWPG